MRRAIVATSIAVLAAACTNGRTTEASRGPSVVAVSIPSGTPASFGGNVEVSDLPAERLVPAGTVPTDLWPAIAPDGGQFALIAFAAVEGDPLRRQRGLVVWRRTDADPPWRPVFGLSDPPEAGVIAVHALIGDATGDGSPDAITFEDTGGSGSCGTWRVIDLAANSGIFERQACDTTVAFSPDPVGLVVQEAVFHEGDAHCCPSATRASILTFGEGSGWTVFATSERPT